jgi:hypothetical protein
MRRFARGGSPVSTVFGLINRRHRPCSTEPWRMLSTRQRGLQSKPLETSRSQSFFKDRFEGAVEKALAKRGLEHSSANPDLLIHYHASITQDAST